MQKTQQKELKFTIQPLRSFFSIRIWQNISFFLLWHFRGMLGLIKALIDSIQCNAGGRAARPEMLDIAAKILKKYWVFSFFELFI